MQPLNGKIDAGRSDASNIAPTLTYSNIRGIRMATTNLPKTDLQNKQCTKCGEVKPIESFPKRSGRSAHLREHRCGMCKRRANLARHPEKKRIENYRRRAREQGVTFAEYVGIQHRKKWQAEIRKQQTRRLVIDGILVKM